MSKPDGSPAINESIVVTARDHSNGIYLEKVFETNQMGEIDYSICQGIMENTSTLSLFVSKGVSKLGHNHAPFCMQTVDELFRELTCSFHHEKENEKFVESFWFSVLLEQSN